MPPKTEAPVPSKEKPSVFWPKEKPVFAPNEAKLGKSLEADKSMPCDSDLTVPPPPKIDDEALSDLAPKMLVALGVPVVEAEPKIDVLEPEACPAEPKMLGVDVVSVLALKPPNKVGVVELLLADPPKRLVEELVGVEVLPPPKRLLEPDNFSPLKMEDVLGVSSLLVAVLPKILGLLALPALEKEKDVKLSTF